MAEGTFSFGQIYLSSRGGSSQGQLRLGANGMTWKGSNTGSTVEIKKDEVEALFWTKVTRGCQLVVRRKQGSTLNFVNFREKDLESLQSFCTQHFGVSIKDQPLSTSGRNWGSLTINGSSLAFVVDGKVAFEIPLPDISQAQQQKDDVTLEFHTDDTASNDKEDVLTEMAFHIPGGCQDFQRERVEGKPEDPPSKIFLDEVLQHTDAGAATSDDAVCVFADVAILAPRGRFEVEMHLGFLSLVGQTQDFKIRYQSIQRIFVLPKSATPHTLVVVSLEPPIRKGQTYYTHVLCQFPTDEEVTIELDITAEQLAAKNEKCGGKLQASASGPVFDVFARVLRGLSGARITRPGSFKNALEDGCSVRCSYKSDEGHLYPLDRAFFYVHKPPLLIPFDEVENVEFMREGRGVISSSVRTFDLAVRTRGEQEHLFRNIQRNEWQNLFNFINAKKLRIDNLATAQHGPGTAGVAIDIGDDLDPGMRRAAAEAGESDEDDEDFNGAGSGSESESGDEASGSGSGSDVEMIDEEGISAAAFVAKAKPKKRGREGDDDGDGEDEAPKQAKAPKEPKPQAAKEPKEKAAPKEKAPPKEKAAPKSKGKAAADESGGSTAAPKEKKPRKKKDPNAPKKALSAFMYFGSANRDKIKAENPGVSFGEMGKLLGERWKSLSAEERAPYEAQAAKDKERYAAAMVTYKGGAGAAAADADADEEGDGGSDAE